MFAKKEEEKPRPGKRELTCFDVLRTEPDTYCVAPACCVLSSYGPILVVRTCGRDLLPTTFRTVSSRSPVSGSFVHIGGAWGVSGMGHPTCTCTEPGVAAAAAVHRRAALRPGWRARPTAPVPCRCRQAQGPRQGHCRRPQRMLLWAVMLHLTPPPPPPPP